MFIVFIIGGIFFGIIYWIVIAIFGNREAQHTKKKLEEIDKKIEDFENKVFLTPEEKEKEKYLLKKDLIKLKAKIFDIKLRAEAGDKINIL